MWEEENAFNFGYLKVVDSVTELHYISIEVGKQLLLVVDNGSIYTKNLCWFDYILTSLWFITQTFVR